MYVLFCSMFINVKNNEFVNAYMLVRLIIFKMHCSSIALNNGCNFANLSELSRALLSAKCKYCLHSRNSVFVITTTRLWQSYHLSQHISFLGSQEYPLTKRIVRKALSLSTVMVNIWLPFKWV